MFFQFNFFCYFIFYVYCMIHVWRPALVREMFST